MKRKLLSSYVKRGAAAKLALALLAMGLLLGGIGAIVWALTSSTATEARLNAAASNGTPQTSASNVGGARTLDDLFEQIAQAVPGFGGMFYDERGDLYVYLLDPTQQALAETATAFVFGPGRVPKERVHVLQGEYPFSELKKWHDRMVDVLAIRGVVFTDIDESKNRLTVGVHDPGTIGVVRQELDRLGVPQAAAKVEQTEPITFATTLQDRVRPLLGGLQINFSTYACTLGFNAIRAGLGGFVTNSHCTNTQGGVEGTIYHQPIASGVTNRIGVETVDPPFSTGGLCPAGRRCRYSDSAFAQRDAGIGADLGFLERTSALGSIQIAGSYRIAGTVAFPVLGELLNKVGRTTGWSQGTVSATCQDIDAWENGQDTGITLLCQDMVAAGVGGGDSGSPVFRITNSPSANDVNLYGILWGGNQAGTAFVFSAISQVQFGGELGPLTVAPAPTPTPTNTPVTPTPSPTPTPRTPTPTRTPVTPSPTPTPTNTVVTVTPSPTPTPTNTPVTPSPTPTPTNTPVTPSPTPTHFPLSPTPSYTPTPTNTPVTPSPTPTPTNTPVTPSPTPTPTPFITPTPTVTGTVTVTPQATLRIDADITNGARPCDPIDDTATVSKGSKHKVGVCIEDYVLNSVEAFELHIRYTGDPNASPPTTLNVATEKSTSGPMLDGNPDANDGNDPAGFKLGDGWDCAAFGLSPPVGDDPNTVGVADARIMCYANLTTLDRDLTANPGLLATIEFTAIGVGTDTIDFGPIDASNLNSVGRPRQGGGIANCGTRVPADQVGCFGATIHKVCAGDADCDGVPDSVDNCPLVPNPGQENTDAAIDNGPGVPGNDTTIPNAVADSEGDACETDGDIDNDGLPDAQDTNPLTGAGLCSALTTNDGHPHPAGGDVTNDDNHNGCPAPPMSSDTSDNGPSWDTDNDGVPDGVECTLGHNPRDRTNTPSTADCGGTGDTDGDGLKDAWEKCGWGTNPNVVDSDGDGLGDCVEAADVNGNGVVDFVEDVMYYARAILLPCASFGKTMDFDLDKNGVADFGGDLLLEARFALKILPCK